MATTWTIEVDWERTGNFTGTYDDVTERVINADWFLGFRKPYADVADENMLALSLEQAQQIRDDIALQYRNSQTKFVETLERTWQETVAFFRVLKRFPQWRRTALRATSLLERVNRMLRRLFRPAGAFHSMTGLLATIARVLNPKRLI
jgi:mutator family transposase